MGSPDFITLSDMVLNVCRERVEDLRAGEGEGT